jgi:predicted small secreted protein
MKQLRTILLRILIATLLATALTSCGTTTENGVTIEKSGNPLKFW